jgi:hypothetical protein
MTTTLYYETETELISRYQNEYGFNVEKNTDGTLHVWTEKYEYTETIVQSDPLGFIRDKIVPILLHP